MKSLVIYLFLLLPTVYAQPLLPPDQMPDAHMGKMAAPAAPAQKEFALWHVLASYDVTKKNVSADLKANLDKEVTVAGFIIPLDFEADKVSEFLLVPYVPSCMHVPPPSENQIIQVTLLKGKKVEAGMLPMVVKGKLSLMKKDELKKGDDSFLPDAVFSMQATDIKEYSN